MQNTGTNYVPCRSPIVESWETYETFSIFEKRHGKIMNEKDKVVAELSDE
jgi:hypothetical protein